MAVTAFPGHAGQTVIGPIIAPDDDSARGSADGGRRSLPGDRRRLYRPITPALW